MLFALLATLATLPLLARAAPASMRIDTAVLAPAPARSSAKAPWRHAWDTALQSQFIDYGYSVLTPAQTSSAASHYAIVSLEKCTSGANYSYTEDAIYFQASQYRQASASVRVLFYWAVDQQGLGCYRAYSQYMATPSFWLRDDAGQLTFNNSNGVPLMDFTNAAARDWWVRVPLNGTGSPAAHLLDGVLADGTGSRCPGGSGAGLSPARCAALVAAKSAMIRQLQALLDSTNGGSVIQNGIDNYPGGPADHNLYSLADADGIMGEHFAVFESVTPDGGLNATLVTAFINAVATAAAADKTVVIGTWPGLLVTPFTKDGWPSWPNNSQPTDMDGWRAALTAKHVFALAAFLTIAEDNVFMQYEGWYSSTQGAVQCNDSPQSCAAPLDWYPELSRPLGAPAGPAVRTGNVFRRSFAHADVLLDLDIPDNSRVSFSNSKA